MAKISSGPATIFTIVHNGGLVKISTNDHIRFMLEFENGQRKEMVFEVGVDFDLVWTIVSEPENKRAREIGRLIEKKMWETGAAR